MCVVELASTLAGGRFTDRPASVCPSVAALLRVYNDKIDDRRRQDLYRYASECVGTRTGQRAQDRRVVKVLDAGDRWRSQRSWWWRLPRGLGFRPCQADGPESAARYCVASLGRLDDAAHSTMLSFLDELIAPAHRSRDLRAGDADRHPERVAVP
jgi:hypothetical protein